MNIEHEMTLKKLLDDPQEFRWMIRKLRLIGAKMFDDDDRAAAMNAIDECEALLEFAKENYQFPVSLTLPVEPANTRLGKMD